ncbi:MAG: hypothetical protein O3B09_00515, partial [Proteobacteria bacterium]|nr:hypothetical protein [Pseudomonadota bacterium]
ENNDEIKNQISEIEIFSKIYSSVVTYQYNRCIFVKKSQDDPSVENPTGNRNQSGLDINSVYINDTAYQGEVGKLEEINRKNKIVDDSIIEALKKGVKSAELKSLNRSSTSQSSVSSTIDANEIKPFIDFLKENLSNIGSDDLEGLKEAKQEQPKQGQGGQVKTKQIVRISKSKKAKQEQPKQGQGGQVKTKQIVRISKSKKAKQGQDRPKVTRIIIRPHGASTLDKDKSHRGGDDKGGGPSRG